MAARGRPARALDPHGGPVARFANDLQGLRDRAPGSPTLAALAMRTGYAVSTLSELTNGRAVPPWNLVEAFVRACGSDPQRWRGLWVEAARSAGEYRDEIAATSSMSTSSAGSAAGAGPRLFAPPPPDPRAARSPKEFVEQLVLLRAWAQNPGLRELERLARVRDMRLPRSTVSDVLSAGRAGQLPRWELVEAYVTACRLYADRLGMMTTPGYREAISTWKAAWHLVNNDEQLRLHRQHVHRAEGDTASDLPSGTGSDELLARRRGRWFTPRQPYA